MLSVNGKNGVKKNEVIFMQGEQVKQVGIVLSGKVLMESEYFKLVRPQGSFLALNDLNREEYSGTYTAMEDSVIYTLPVVGQEPLRDIINKNADYRAIMIASQFKYVTAVARIRQDLYDRVSRFYTFAKRSYENYQSACLNADMSVIEFEELSELPMYERIEAVGEDKLGYYAAAAKIPLGANKLYFSYSEEMVDYQVMEVLELVDSFKEDIAAMVEYLKDLLSLIAHRDNHNLLEYACVQGQEMRRGGNVSEDMQELLSDIVREVDFQYTALKKQIMNVAQIDMDVMRARVSDVITKEMTEMEKKDKEEKEATVKRDVLSLKGSMEQVIKYGGLEEEIAEKLRTNVEYLVKAPDRLSVEDDVKKAKKAITPIVFDLYLACFRKMYIENRGVPKAVELFLNFGMLDERLLEQEQLEFLCGIDIAEDDGPCNVFTMVEWLTAIQEGKREASKSEFDEDYIENLRTLKKQGDITEEQMKKLANDMDRRVEYEVRNMMMSNMRVVYGQPTAYMPILYKEAIYGYLDKILVTKKAINESVTRLMKIDYSAFYREVIYSNNDLKIINETTMKNVYPDIILFPLFGINASMWQEVGGKSKSTPGRFVFPMLTNTNIDDMMVKMFGRFRWELCRNIQGMQWNDIKIKSLTSEYMDYIQFYRKNRELSEEWREKVKLQIQKGRNNTREIFLMDYEAWVKNESNGSMKLNKVSRELLATYCPFEKGLRVKLNGQRAYELAQARHGRNCQKKTQEFELKMKALQKETDDIPKEIMDTYKFFSEM